MAISPSPSLLPSPQTAYNHLLLYDGECGLCDATVQAVLRRDSKQTFCFAPLQGVTAAQFREKLHLTDLPLDSVILIEHFRLPTAKAYFRSQAVWRVCWHLGGFLTLPGLLGFLPGFLFDWGYRIVARLRYRLFGRIRCPLPSQSMESNERFLP